MRKRKQLRDRTKLAAMICIYLELPHEVAKGMTEDEVIALVGEWDHYPVRHVDGGPDTHWNVRPLFREDHKEKTKRDATDMARERKVRRAGAKHQERMQDRMHDPMEYTRSMKTAPSRWPKQPRKLQSRNDLRRRHQ